MPTPPVEQQEAPADVGLETTTAPSAVDPAPVPAESPAVEKELSEEDHQAKFLEIALQAADAAKGPKAETPPAQQPAPTENSAQTKATPAETPAQKAETDEDAEDEGEDRGEPFGKHPRWQKMVAARNEYRDKANAASQEVEALRSPAHEYGQIQHYMQSNGLTPAEVIDGFKIMALMKADPAAAREALAVHMNRLDSFLGNILPPDLQRQVDEGFTTEEIAREVVRSRNAQLRTQNENQQYREHLEHQQVEQLEAQTRQGMVQAVSQWEAQVRTRDPDYALKEQFVVDKLRVLRTQYRVQTPEQAVQLAQMAYDEASKALRGLTRKPEVRPNNAGNLAVSGVATKPEARNFEEACLQAAGFTQK